MSKKLVKSTVLWREDRTSLVHKSRWSDLYTAGVTCCNSDSHLKISEDPMKQSRLEKRRSLVELICDWTWPSVSSLWYLIPLVLAPRYPITCAEKVFLWCFSQLPHLFTNETISNLKSFSLKLINMKFVLFAKCNHWSSDQFPISFAFNMQFCLPAGVISGKLKACSASVCFYVPQRPFQLPLKSYSSPFFIIPLCHQQIQAPLHHTKWA